MKRLLGAALFSVLVVAAPVGAEEEKTGKELFDAQCASCHGEDGRGDTPAGRQLGVQDWTESSVLKEMSDEELAKITREGVVKDGKPVMPAYKHLSEDQIESLVGYMRSLQE